MKKAISFVLAALMLVSAVPTALATNDYSQGTQVVYEATGSESYTITVPAALNPGQSGTVTLDGMWPSYKTISVTAEPTVTLTNSILASDQKVLDITFLGINEAGSDTAKQTFTETVSVESIENALFGTWSGKFNYNVDTHSDIIELASADDIYALSRILSPETVKTNFLGATYAIEDDLNRFDYPNDATSNSEKIEYLSAAPYKLVNDVELTLQRTNNTSFFLGIGSKEHPFKGSFNGNERTITLLSNNAIAVNDNINHDIGLFGTVEGATISNVKIETSNDILINKCTGNLIRLGSLVGYAYNSNITNCDLLVSSANIGVDYGSTETYVAPSCVGGLVGEAKLSTIKNCTVKLTDGKVYAKGYTVDKDVTYGNFSVGGLLGVSSSGSNNQDYIGRIGNQLLNCKVISTNTTQQDVIYASLEYGDELTVGGLLGLSYNNFVAKDCSVEITKGNIVAQKTGATDSAQFGTQAGGIIGRLEHTGELNNCSVNGNYLNIISICENGDTDAGTTAGGIVGFDLGPYHRNITSLSNCSFDGNGTSVISVKNATGRPLVGGIAGYTGYKVAGCSAKNVTLKNVSVNKGFAGSLFGRYGKISGMWHETIYFTPDAPEIKDCTYENIIFDVTDNVEVGEIYGRM